MQVSRTDEPQVSANHNRRRLITNNCGNKYKTMFNLKILIYSLKKINRQTHKKVIENNFSGNFNDFFFWYI